MLEQQIAKAGLEEDFILAGAVENPYPYLSDEKLKEIEQELL